MANTGTRKRFCGAILALALCAMLLWAGGALASDEAPWRTSGDYKYIENGDGTVTIVQYTGMATELAVPGALTPEYTWGPSGATPLRVTGIGAWAFSSCSQLTRVTLPDSVTSLASGAFRKCSALAEITLPAGISYIGDGALSYCTALTAIEAPGNAVYTSVDGVLIDRAAQTLVAYPAGKSAGRYTVPGDIASIGPGAFAGAPALTAVVIPDTVTGIGEGAFADCSGLTAITLPGSVTSIGERAFSGCAMLRTIDVSAGNAVYASVDGVLIDRAAQTLIAYPAGKSAERYMVAGDIARIGPDAFAGAVALAAVVIPDTVTDIGEGAFAGCSGLTAIALPGSVTAVEAYTFSRCAGLKSVTIPGAVARVGDGAFEGCAGLSYVTLSAGVTDIRENVFAGCNALLTLRVPSGSFAERYAKAHKIRYIT
ncbi:hypothetical protein FACS1894196_2190 [Clostridia bacterium]|nr:hypothetical protein FACS1894196_2190 [Clostridia bacterium]